jgi:tripartite-type tricarboxylate transporter receptor subunit TctC
MNQRLPALPDVPTIAESGYPDYDLSTWHGYSGPAGVPRPIVDYLANAYSKMVKSPEITHILQPDGGVPVGSSPEMFSKMINAEIAHWRALVKKIDLTVQ